jgi:hypothetical protein
LNCSIPREILFKAWAMIQIGVFEIHTLSNTRKCENEASGGALSEKDFWCDDDSLLTTFRYAEIAESNRSLWRPLGIGRS